MAGQPVTHTCHAEDCTTPVPPRMFMCRMHWFALPKSYQDAIWATYRPGQERDKDPSFEYLAAARNAVNYLSGRGAHTPECLAHLNRSSDQCQCGGRQ